jgi:transposase
MAIREGNREQMQMLPPSIEQYIPEDAPVRVYDAFVDYLNLEELGIKVEPNKEGNPCYHPRTMLKLLIYAYSYGIRSSRKIERETHYNLSFIWLMGGLKPDHKTIAEFRRKYKEALHKALSQCVRLCAGLDMIAGNIFFVDGSKIRGKAGIKNSWTEKKAQQAIERAEKRIEEILKEAEELDAAEEGQPSLVSVTTQLTKSLSRKQKVSQILEELQASGKKNLNTVDPECTTINSVQGTGAGYTVEVTVDDQYGLIVSADAVSANNDLGQFTPQIEQAEANLGKAPQIAVADSGFADTNDLAKIDEREIQVIVPSQRIVSNRQIGEFDKENFQYDKARDCYICPQGQELHFQRLVNQGITKEYGVLDKKTCLECQCYGRCTTARNGRKVTRLVAEEVRERLEQEYAREENQIIYKRRQLRIELVFGHMKRNLGVRSFLLRGLAGARAEISLLAICFNIRRMMTILGREGLIQKLKEVLQRASASVFSLNNLLANIFSGQKQPCHGHFRYLPAFVS